MARDYLLFLSYQYHSPFFWLANLDPPLGIEFCKKFNDLHIVEELLILKNDVCVDEILKALEKLDDWKDLSMCQLLEENSR